MQFYKHVGDHIIFSRMISKYVEVISNHYYKILWNFFSLFSYLCAYFSNWYEQIEVPINN